MIADKAKVQRSQTTGVLQLTMPKASISEVQARNMRLQKAEEEKKNAAKLKELEKQQQEAKLKAKQDLIQHA